MNQLCTDVYMRSVRYELVIPILHTSLWKVLVVVVRYVSEPKRVSAVLPNVPAIMFLSRLRPKLHSGSQTPGNLVVSNLFCEHSGCPPKLIHQIFKLETPSSRVHPSLYLQMSTQVFFIQKNVCGCILINYFAQVIKNIHGKRMACCWNIRHEFFPFQHITLYNFVYVFRYMERPAMSWFIR